MKNIDYDLYRQAGIDIGMDFVDFEDGVLMYQKKVNVDGFPKYEVIYCTSDCITNGNLNWMATNGYTLTKEKVRSLQKKWRKRQQKVIDKL